MVPLKTMGRKLRKGRGGQHVQMVEKRKDFEREDVFNNRDKLKFMD
jgi:hypothetical protein